MLKAFKSGKRDFYDLDSVTELLGLFQMPSCLAISRYADRDERELVREEACT